ncbi:MAG: hypothetical protein ACYC7A_14215 [Thermoanaerobaculia bacterium]
MRPSPRLWLFPFVLVLVQLVAAAAVAQPYTRNVYNRSATKSVVCTAACTMTPATCGPGQNCTVYGWGFLTMSVTDGSDLLWDFTLRDGAGNDHHDPAERGERLPRHYGRRRRDRRS